MLKSEDIRLVTVVARTESLAEAARVLGITPSAVTQRLQDIERRLGVRLVNRSGRRVVLTAEGELMAERGQKISDEIALLEEILASRRDVIAGPLRVLAPLGFGRRYVAPVASAFCEAHPEITLELQLSDRLGRVPETSWDVAIHIGKLRESSLVARRIAPNARWLCASPAFIAKHGAPHDPTDLSRFPCIALRENDEDVTLWRFKGKDGAPQPIRIQPRLASNDGEVVRDWAINGDGIIVRSEWSVANEIRAGRLVRLLQEFDLPPADVIAFTGARRGRAVRTIRFVDALKAALAPVPWRQDTSPKQ